MLRKLHGYFQHIDEHTKHVIDYTSIGVAVGSLLQWLPSVAAALSIVWTSIRIYETKTVQAWLRKRKNPNA